MALAKTVLVSMLVESSVVSFGQEYEFSSWPLEVLSYLYEAFSRVDGLTAMVALPRLGLVSDSLVIVLNEG